MLVLRFLLILGLVSVAVTLSVFLLTRNRQYLRLSWQLAKFSAVLILILYVVLVLSRILL
jgi:hypothetical protein